MDNLDRKILQIIQNNGRITNAELSRELNLAPSTMLERIRRLEDKGVITGYSAEIDPASVGLDVQGFISVTLSRHDVDYIERFERDIANIPEVKACYHITGRFDYLLQIAAKDLNSLGALVKNRIASIEGIGKAETFLMLSEVKPDKGWYIENAENPDKDK